MMKLPVPLIVRMTLANNQKTRILQVCKSHALGFCVNIAEFLDTREILQQSHSDITINLPIRTTNINTHNNQQSTNQVTDTQRTTFNVCDYLPTFCLEKYCAKGINIQLT
jgi:hypothetical protein